jgi:hypothetical protein
LSVGFGLEIGFIGHFSTRLVTTLNYRAIADLHTLKITTAHAFFSVCCVFTIRSLVTATNSGDSWATALTSLLSGEYPTNLLSPHFQRSLITPVVLLMTSWHGPRRKHRSLLYSNRFHGNMCVCEGVTQ